MKKTQRLIATAVTMLLLWSICAGQALAAFNILFILDTSGKMTGKLSKETKLIHPTKIQIAKDAFGSLLDDLPKDVNVGLEVYGHHSDRDCSAIEVMNPVAPLDVSALSANAQTLSPERGAAPLSKALEQGGEELKDSQGDKTIVLISNGKDTCGGDPVRVARTLKKQDLNITTQVVGIGVNEEESAQLSAIAEAGGGKYYSVITVDDMKKSLDTIKERVIDKKPETDVFFRDEFNDGLLSDKWEVLNADKDDISIENGVLTIVVSGANPKNPENILRLRLPIPKGDWVIKANISLAGQTITEAFDLGVSNKDESQQILAQIYIETYDNAISSITLGGIKNTSKSSSSFHKELFSSGDLKQQSDFLKEHVKSITVELQKIGNEYIASAKLEPINKGDEAVSLSWVTLQKLISVQAPVDNFFIKVHGKNDGGYIAGNLNNGVINLNWVELQIVKPMEGTQK